MKSFRQFILESKEPIFWHGSLSSDTKLSPGTHIGTRAQAEQRIKDRTEFRNAPAHFHSFREKVKRSPDEHIEIEDDGAPSLNNALSKAAKLGKVPENSARIAKGKSDGEKARILMKYGIYRVTYKNKYEGEGISHIIVNPDDFEEHKKVIN